MKVFQERQHQDTKFGNQDHHSSAKWIAILAEEVGELALAVDDGVLTDQYFEAIQVAATAVAMAQSIKSGSQGERTTTDQVALTRLLADLTVVAEAVLLDDDPDGQDPAHHGTGNLSRSLSIVSDNVSGWKNLKDLDSISSVA